MADVKFKAGDRVRATDDGFGYAKGEIGTVLLYALDQCPFVLFDEESEDRDLTFTFPGALPLRCCAVVQGQLELIVDEAAPAPAAPTEDNDRYLVVPIYEGHARFRKCSTVVGLGNAKALASSMLAPDVLNVEVAKIVGRAERVHTSAWSPAP